MFEQPANQETRPTRRRRVPPWGLFAVLLATSLWLAVHYGTLARQDAVVAPREQVAVGTMLKLTHGKHTTVWYSFTYAGRQYRGSDTVSPNHCFCDVTVYFDPANPSTNTLVEYKRKTWADHLTMTFCLWMSAAFAALLVVAMAIRRRKPEPDFSHVS
ncbi:MAG: hypothetical protein WCA44_02445 [Acidobacteriaceae bacterium]